MVTRRHPQYESLGAGQPPQVLSLATPPPAWCICCKRGVIEFAPQRPMHVHCWSKYRNEPIVRFRNRRMVFCHGCGKQDRTITFGTPLCGACAADYVHPLAA